MAKTYRAVKHNRAKMGMPGVGASAKTASGRNLMKKMRKSASQTPGEGAFGDSNREQERNGQRRGGQ